MNMKEKNELGIFFAYWLRNWGEADLSELTVRASNLGFDVLGLHSDVVMDLSPKERDKLRETGREEGIEFTFCTGLSEENDISSPDPQARKAGIEHLQKSIEMIADLGGDTFSGIIHGSWGLPAEGGMVDKPAYLERSIESMRQVVKTAEEQGVCCNVEVVNRFENFMINTCEEALEYIEAVDSPNMKMLLDTYHMNIEEDSLKEAIVEAGDQLGHFHVGENNRKPPGQGGHIDWDGVFEGLREIDYEGKIVMEPFLLSGGDVASDIMTWRDMAEKDELDEKARKARAFIEGKLQG